MSSSNGSRPSSFMRTSSDRSFASRASSTKSGSTCSSTSSGASQQQLLQSSIYHTRTGSFADFVVKFSEFTQDLTTCSSMDRIKFPKEAKQSQATVHAKMKASTWAVECECIEVEENDVLQTAYELNRV